MVEIFARDDKTAALHREATAFADVGDMGKAVASLRKATKRMKTSPVAYPVETWLRLPLYLQKAGQFKKAMVEFKRILEDTDRRIDHGRTQYIDDELRQRILHSDLRAIYDKMRLVCKREGEYEAAAKYEALRTYP